MLYQGMNISGPKAIDKVQKICNAITMELKLEQTLIALEFLRNQLQEEGVDVEAEIAALEPDLDEDDELA
jgi:hypothetical protein